MSNYFEAPTTDESVAAMLGGWDRAGELVQCAVSLVRSSIEAASRPARPDEVAEDVDLLIDLMALQDRMRRRSERWRELVTLRVVESCSKAQAA